nr:DUF3782 domain-containing protein [Candidatus Sigynarchaeota archaeon]
MTMKNIDIDELLKILPKLIRENDTVKGAIISALSGVVATKEDIRELIREMDKRFDTMQKESNQRFEAIQKELVSLRMDIKRIAVELATLSMRSGDDLEIMVRELLADTLVKNKINVSDVKKVQLVDAKGEIFAPGYDTAVDVAARNGDITLYEIKYRADQRDAYHFMQVARLYELVNGCKPNRLVMIVLEISNATLRAIAKFPIPIDVIPGSIVP